MKKEIIVIMLLLAVLAGCAKKDDTAKSTDTASTTASVQVSSATDTAAAEVTAIDTVDDYEIPTDAPETSAEITVTDTTIASTPGNDTVASEVIPTETITENTTEKDEPSPDEYIIGEYTKYGYTDLSISKVITFNSSFPGEENVFVFSEGDSLMMNLFCNPQACMESVLYVVPAGTPHKNSYTADEAVITQDMFFFFESGEGLAVGDITIPSGVTPGVYDFRFVCGGIEEGFVSYIIE